MMKKVNGYGWIIQLVIFVIAIIYFLGYRDQRVSAEIYQVVTSEIQSYELEQVDADQKVLKELQSIKVNLKRSMEDQGVTWIE